MKNKIIYTIIVIITILLWIASKDDSSFYLADTLLAISQISALLGSVTVSIPYILASRHPLVEKYIAPLDELYSYHRWLGTVGGSLIIIHLLTLIIRALPNTKLAMSYFIPSGNPAYTMGILAFYSFILLVVISLYRYLSYNVWKILHVIFGLGIVANLLHILKIGSDLAESEALNLWMIFITLNAISFWIYRRLVYTVNYCKYEIVDVKKESAVARIIMKPVEEKLMYDPGQFAFFKFVSKEVRRESHPFSIISLPEDPNLEIGVKDLGDNTRKFGKLKAGDVVKVYGPHGGFGRQYGKGKQPVLIGAGIGIAPLLPLLKTGDADPIVFYCTNSVDEAVYHRDILALAEKDKSIDYSHFCTGDQGHLSVESMKKRFGDDLTKYEYYLCGPSEMIKQISEKLVESGVSKRDVHSEKFEFVEG